MRDYEGQLSDCCGAKIVMQDVCSECKEHCEPEGCEHEWELIDDSFNTGMGYTHESMYLECRLCGESKQAPSKREFRRMRRDEAKLREMEFMR